MVAFHIGGFGTCRDIVSSLPSLLVYFLLSLFPPRKHDVPPFFLLPPTKPWVCYT